MILTDTGPLVALINRKDPNHKRCVEACKNLPPVPLSSTWPCFTEAMYLLFRAGGFAAQAALWRMTMAGRLVLVDLAANDLARMSGLMTKYRDKPMDLADASLVCVAERQEVQRIFTLDSDFLVYRLPDGSNLQIVP